MKAIRYEKNTVLIQDRNIKAWVDVWIENEDVICDWNQNDFILTDPKDVALKNWQDEIENFEDATNIAITTLENLGVIYQDEKGKWYQTEKYHTVKDSLPIN